MMGGVCFMLVAPLTAMSGVGIMFASAFVLMILSNLIEIMGISRLK